MRKLPPLIKRMPPAPTPVAPDAARVPIALLAVEPDARQRAALSGAQRATLRALHREADEQSMGGPFDRRTFLALDDAARERWLAARGAWLLQLFADDPRVTV